MNNNYNKMNSFKDIKSFKDACLAINLDHTDMFRIACEIAIISKSSAAMFKLNIIKTALDSGYDLHLTKNPEDSSIYHPAIPFKIEKFSCLYEESKILGKIEYKDEKYFVIDDGALSYMGKGLGNFDPSAGKGFTPSDNAFFGCATKEIAEHFGKYFGMLITEAKYGDLPYFKIVSSKYSI